ncbi:CPBP family intramembrane glutamic endopeptidase [Shewanella gaetbuli]|uniref:CPBP family intramembrane metalloprotease n=1 Tax=Shewanella gaetbuli TaxID=220752 RepID=A0A9X1ZRG1_9GAMM|nr:CPBP family intramembrane glutamic endopeptidase [Shewanella gaetbuli]MCL1142738.1 CPBP family intramembrane metalloprotease [Shewanella gaetbuli]
MINKYIIDSLFTNKKSTLAVLYFLLLFYPVFSLCNDFTISLDSFRWIHLILAIFFLIAAFFEEFVFRYVLPELFGKCLIKLLVYSCIFSVAHTLNGGFSFSAFINTVIISILLYQMRYELGFQYAVLFHWLWNSIIAVAFGGVLSGVNVSKIIENYSSIFQALPEQPLYGVESDWLLTVSMLTTFLIIKLLQHYANNRGTY